MVNNDFDQGGVFVLVWYNQIILFVVRYVVELYSREKKISTQSTSNNIYAVIPVESVKNRKTSSSLFHTFLLSAIIK